MDGLTNLKALTLALFLSLTELPSFDKLANLERLMLVTLPTIKGLPNLGSLEKLKTFTVNDRGSWCCNGFLDPCNLNDSFCAAMPLFGFPPALCLEPSDPRATSETRAVVNKFSSTVCQGPEPKILAPGPPTPEGIAQCDGILYRRCNVSGFEEAMCYNARFMAISCDAGPLAIKMRRRQIEQGVGDRCNPEYEAWLGCT
ncbi:hypothetical protein ON010_g15093 [Phytophthora cinnamomi]|nr:hypothetical protein ON010_g15093 [Phytophthora cinnamomi]